MVILQPDVVVGVTGDSPDRVIERLIAVRERPVDEVVKHLRGEADAEFVVAALAPARLWKVGDGNIDGPREAGRQWAGDLAAFEVFQTRMGDRGADALGLSFQMMSSMQFLTSFGVVPSVGGITMRVEGTDDGFFFIGDHMHVGPNRMEVTSVEVTGGDMKAAMSVPEGGDPVGYDFNIIPGEDPTRGAVALFIPQTGKGLVFSHDRPWEPALIAADTTAGFAAAAETEGTHLNVPPSLFGGPS